MIATCAWCDAPVPEADGYRLPEADAAFCRLEHVVPWAMTKGEEAERFTLVRHRGEHRIADEFRSLEELRAWAAAGGRFAKP